MWQRDCDDRSRRCSRQRVTKAVHSVRGKKCVYVHLTVSFVWCDVVVAMRLKYSIESSACRVVYRRIVSFPARCNLVSKGCLTLWRRCMWPRQSRVSSAFGSDRECTQRCGCAHVHRRLIRRSRCNDDTVTDKLCGACSITSRL